MSNIKLSASILAADFAKLGEEISSVERCGADRIHVDILDGHFAPNISFGANAVSVARKFSTLPIEAHLMVLDDLLLASHLIPAVAKEGADVIVIHAERCLHIHRMLGLIRTFGKKAGVALNPGTSLTSVAHLLHLVDHILVMTVNPGFAGQDFITDMLPKIVDCKNMVHGRNIEICVDGGVKPSNVRVIYESGADIVVAASAIFNHGKNGDYSHVIAQIKNCV